MMFGDEWWIGLKWWEEKWRKRKIEYLENLDSRLRNMKPLHREPVPNTKYYVEDRLGGMLLIAEVQNGQFIEYRGYDLPDEMYEQARKELKNR